MHITRYTDYSLRVLVYLSTQREELATIQQIADAYDISKNHLMKVVHQLNRKGYIETIRGKKGGMRLRLDPKSINVGVLIRETEQELGVVECLSTNDGCRISPVCGLKGIFSEAVEAFLRTLDQYTLDDVIANEHEPQLLRLLQIH